MSSSQQGLQTSKYFNVAAAAILLQDYCLTLDSEVRWVRAKRWSLSRVMFTLARYVPFIGTALTLQVALNVPGSHTDCIASWDVGNAFHFISIVAAECLLTFRVFVLYDCNRRLLFSLIGLATVMLAAALITSLAPFASMPSAGQPSTSDCSFEGSRNNALPFAALLLYECVLALILIIRRCAYRGPISSFLAQLYNDGLFYMFFIISISAANITVVLCMPLVYSDLLDAPQVVVHCILSCRILFRLQGSEPDEASGEPTSDAAMTGGQPVPSYH